MKAHGTVKWYDKKKGFGFIENPDGDVFFYHGAIQMAGFRSLSDGDKVDYEYEMTDAGLKATSVTPCGKPLQKQNASRYRTLRTLVIDDNVDFDDLVAFMQTFHQTFQEEYDRVGVNGVMLYGSSETGELVELVNTDCSYDSAMDKITAGPLKDVYAAYLKKLSDLSGGEYEVLSTM
jgi:CspA family cold shock protein